MGANTNLPGDSPRDGDLNRYRPSEPQWFSEEDDDLRAAMSAGDMDEDEEEYRELGAVGGIHPDGPGVGGD